MNFGMKTFKKPDEVYYMLGTARSLANVKVKLLFHKWLKSITELPSKMLSK